MATLAELQAKKQKALDEAAAFETQIKEEMSKAAEKQYKSVIDILNEYKEVFTADQKKAIASLLDVKAKAARKPRSPNGTVAKTPSAKKDYILNDGKKTPFAWGGKGRKPEVVTAFEASEAGKKLIAAGQPTYTLVEAPKAETKADEKGKEAAKA